MTSPESDPVEQAADTPTPAGETGPRPAGLQMLGGHAPGCAEDTCGLPGTGGW